MIINDDVSLMCHLLDPCWCHDSDEDDHGDGGYDDDTLAPTRHSTYIEFHQDVGGGGMTWQTSSRASPWSSSSSTSSTSTSTWGGSSWWLWGGEEKWWTVETQMGRKCTNIDENEDKEEGEGVRAMGNATKKQRQTYIAYIAENMRSSNSLQSRNLCKRPQQEQSSCPPTTLVHFMREVCYNVYFSKSAASRARRSRGLIACLLPVWNEMCIILVCAGPIWILITARLLFGLSYDVSWGIKRMDNIWKNNAQVLNTK